MSDKAQLSIELNPSQPHMTLTYAELWQCPVCWRHTALIVDEIWSCVFCMLAKSGKDSIVVSGWLLTRSSLNIINASRVKQSGKS